MSNQYQKAVYPFITFRFYNWRISRIPVILGKQQLYEALITINLLLDFLSGKGENFIRLVNITLPKPRAILTRVCDHEWVEETQNKR